MISPRNVGLPPWCGHLLSLGFEPVLIYSKPHTFSVLDGQENENMQAT